MVFWTLTRPQCYLLQATGHLLVALHCRFATEPAILPLLFPPALEDAGHLVYYEEYTLNIALKVYIFRSPG